MSILSQVDLSLALDQEEYAEQLARYQIALSHLSYQVYVQKRPVAVVFEGWDAGGKGGAIKRLTERLDPRGYVVYPIAAPAGEDKTRHYLYRFWRRLPERGQIAVFDRSWYGRVMVERIEGFATEAEWKRAYREINSFERQLVDYGTILFKFWIQISKDEQLRRFEERGATPYKAWKLTDEDWRNRGKWDRYEEAVEEMLLKTSTATAPWTIVEGNDKWWARVKVLRTVAEGLTKPLKVKPEILDMDLGKLDSRKGKGKKTREELLQAIDAPDMDETREPEDEEDVRAREAREEHEDRDEKDAKKRKKRKKDDKG
jgi:polyphosphate kinase 2 (PPK2 family)